MNRSLRLLGFFSMSCLAIQSHTLLSDKGTTLAQVLYVPPFGDNTVESQSSDRRRPSFSRTFTSGPNAGCTQAMVDLSEYYHQEIIGHYRVTGEPEKISAYRENEPTDCDSKFQYRNLVREYIFPE